jgi:iron complex transport system ATP-binding protein
MQPHPEVISLSGVTVIRQRKALLWEVDWTVHAHERWVVLGPNGAGKTTMLQVASTYLRPSRGTVRLLGLTHGAADVRDLRRRVGYAGPAPAALVREYLPAREIVVTGKHAAFVDSRWHDYDTSDWERAGRHLERLGAAAVADQTYGTL